MNYLCQYPRKELDLRNCCSRPSQIGLTRIPLTLGDLNKGCCTFPFAIVSLTYPQNNLYIVRTPHIIYKPEQSGMPVTIVRAVESAQTVRMVARYFSQRRTFSLYASAQIAVAIVNNSRLGPSRWFMLATLLILSDTIFRVYLLHNS